MIRSEVNLSILELREMFVALFFAFTFSTADASGPSLPNDFDPSRYLPCGVIAELALTFPSAQPPPPVYTPTDPQQQFALALTYCNVTDGASLDLQQAAIWAEKSAQQDHKDAHRLLFILGVMYGYGHASILPDKVKALDLIQKAARYKVPEAQHFLLNMQPQAKALAFVPLIARRYEDMYRRLVNCKLIYTHPRTGIQQVLTIQAGADPLNYTFDLSRCGNAGQWISIAIGCKEYQTLERKTQVWFVPRFIIEHCSTTVALRYQHLIADWQPTNPLGILWTWSGGYPGCEDYDKLITKGINEITSKNLCALWEDADGHQQQTTGGMRTTKVGGDGKAVQQQRCFRFEC